MTPEEQFELENPPLERGEPSVIVWGCLTWLLVIAAVIAVWRAFTLA